MPVIAEIGAVNITVQEVLDLRRGDVVKLPETKLGDDMMLTIGGRRKYKCTPGLVSNRLAVKLGERIEDVPDELLTSSRSDDEF